jgi:hypothetical protein
MPQFHKRVRKHDQSREDNKWMEKKKSTNAMGRETKDKSTNCYKPQALHYVIIWI